MTTVTVKTSHLGCRQCATQAAIAVEVAIARGNLEEFTSRHASGMHTATVTLQDPMTAPTTSVVP